MGERLLAGGGASRRSLAKAAAFAKTKSPAGAAAGKDPFKFKEVFTESPLDMP
jgi:hypothetical protein